MAYLQIAAAAIGAIGAIKSSSAQAQAAATNAMIAKQNEMATNDQANAAAEMQWRDTERKMGALVAAGGASGVDMSQGSFSDLLADSARSAALDALTLKYNYKLRSLGYQTQAKLYDAESRNATTGGYLSALGTMAGGMSKVDWGSFGSSSQQLLGSNKMKRE